MEIQGGVLVGNPLKLRSRWSIRQCGIDKTWYVRQHSEITCQALLGSRLSYLKTGKWISSRTIRCAGMFFAWHLWPVCFWNLEWWLCYNAQIGPNLQSKTCFHMMRFDAFLPPCRKRFHVTTWLPGSSELLQQHLKVLDDERVTVMLVLKRNVFIINWSTRDLPWLAIPKARATHTHNSAFDPCSRANVGRWFVHAVKSGNGRDVGGGCLIVLMRKGFFDFEGSSQNLPSNMVPSRGSHHPFAVSPNPLGTWKISWVHPIAAQKHLTRCCLSSGSTGLYPWTSWIRLLMAMLKFRGKCNKFVVLPCDSTITRHTAMGCGCHTTVSSFLRELHDVSSWLRIFGTEVHHDADQGFHHEAQAPRITPSGLSCSKTMFVGGITWQVILLGQSTRTFRSYRTLI